MQQASLAQGHRHPLLASLETSLLHLRERWPQAWPGLPLVFDRCWQRLGGGRCSPSDRVQALMLSAHEVAARIEHDGRARQRRAAEPPYHNRLHIADTLVCMTHLLLAQREVRPQSPVLPVFECLALVVMLGHDYLHNGKVNRFPAELESIAVAQLQPILERHGVARQDLTVLNHCILRTDPSSVKPSHALVAGRAFSLSDRDWLAVLVEEADILASTLMVTAEGLTQSLAKEWTGFDPVMAQGLLQPASRIHFLENAALFSSPAASLLGIQGLKQAQVSAARQEMTGPKA